MAGLLFVHKVVVQPEIMQKVVAVCDSVIVIDIWISPGDPLATGNLISFHSDKLGSRYASVVIDKTLELIP